MSVIIKAMIIYFLLLAMPVAILANESESEPTFSEECGTLEEEECRMHRYINNFRQRHQLKELKLFEPCVDAAREHAQDMREREYFSHDRPEETFAERIQRLGIINRIVGENLAQVQPGPGTQKAFKLWLHSPGHRKNIINPEFEYTGIGRAGGFWVQCFASDLYSWD